MLNTPIQGDCMKVLANIPSNSVHLIFVDPPYNIGIFSKMKPAEYLEWCEAWIDEGDRVLLPNGAFWIAHNNPVILSQLSTMLAQRGRGLINWVTWDKYNGADKMKGYLDGYTDLTGLRSFQVMAEYFIYHADEGEWSSQVDKTRGFIFEPLRQYLEGERRRAGISKIRVNEYLGFSPTPGGMASRHYFSKSQWCLPTEEHYEKMVRLFNEEGLDPAPEFGDFHPEEGVASPEGGYLSSYEYLRSKYEYLKVRYDALRAEYSHLRYTFNHPGRVSSVWQFPIAERTWHPTPKPFGLLERIIRTTSNKGDLVLDFFGGSFTTAAVADALGRQWISSDLSERYVKLGTKRIEDQRRQLPLWTD